MQCKTHKYPKKLLAFFFVFRKFSFQVVKLSFLHFLLVTDIISEVGNEEANYRVKDNVKDNVIAVIVELCPGS